MGDSSRTDRVRGTGPRYGRIPEGLLLSQVSDKAKVLFAALDRYAGQVERAWPSRATIARKWLHCSTKTVDRTVEELVASGWVEVAHRTTEEGDPDSNLYLLRWTPLSRGSDTGVPTGSDTGVPGVGPQMSPEGKPMNESQKGESRRRWSSTSREVVSEWWERQDPRPPSTMYASAVSSVEACLRSGSTRAQVLDALDRIDLRYLSARTLYSEVRRAAGPSYETPDTTYSAGPW